MYVNKGTVFLGLAAFSLGAVFSFSQYWEEIKTSAYPDLAQSTQSHTTNDQSQNNSTQTLVMARQPDAESNQIMADTAAIQQLLSLKLPSLDAPDVDWLNFLAQLDAVHTGKRYSNSGVTTPLLPWYAYIAKHRPDIIYAAIDTRLIDSRKFDHLLQTGFLTDWSEHVSNTDSLFLSSSVALSSFAQSFGKEAAQNRLINALFINTSEGDTSARRKIALGNVVFAYSAMSDTQKKQLLPKLLNGSYTIDPRGVAGLTQFPELDREDLLALIHKHAYPNKSMSSYMLTGAQLGDTDYVVSLIDDLETNAKQPTNFYCSICALAMTSDGLIGNAVVKANAQGKLLLTPSKHGAIILSSQRSQ